MVRLILASASPRRKDLLRQIGIEPEIHPADVSEDTTETLPPRVVETLSVRKCRAAAEKLIAEGSTENAGGGKTVVLSADTIVACDGKILGKPADAEDAAAMLQMLQGRTHQVYTGVSMAELAADRVIRETTFSVCTDVTVGPMSRPDILRYIGTGEPMDKAGAYGIQGIFARHVEQISGDYSNVVGLPVHAVWQVLQSWEKEDLCEN